MKNIGSLLTPSIVFLNAWRSLESVDDREKEKNNNMVTKYFFAVTLAGFSAPGNGAPGIICV